MDEKKLREVIRKIIKEMSMTGGGVAGAETTTGSGVGVARKYAYNPNKKAKGTAYNYYTEKLGFTEVPKGRPKSKLMDYRDLWK
jgi:hypothetical protein